MRWTDATIACDGPSSRRVAEAKTFQTGHEKENMRGHLRFTLSGNVTVKCADGGDGEPLSCSTTITSMAPLNVAGLYGQDVSRQP